MKKIFAMAITIMVILTAVAPLVQAQDQKKIDQLQKELEKLGAKAQKGTATEEEMQHMMDITIEITMLKNPGMTYDQAIAQIRQMNSGQIATAKAQAEAEDRRVAEQRKRDDAAAEQAKKREQEQLQRQIQKEEEERKMYPGDTRGWPSSAWLRNAFDAKLSSLKLPAKTNASYDKEGQVIYLTGANANILQDLKKQIESALGSQMTGSGNSFECLFNEVKGIFSSRSYVRIELQGNQITITRRESAG